MTGLIIASHGDLARALLDAAFMIVGTQEGAMALCTRCDDSLEELEVKIKEMAETLLQSHSGVLVMTDIFGGTPTNISIPLLGTNDIEILTGVNLPMVLKFFSQRGKTSLVELANLLKVYAQQGVVLVSESIAD